MPLESYAEQAFQAKAMPSLAMGCGVFLQSDIVNQQRKGWSAEEIMAALAAVLPSTSGSMPASCRTSRAAGRKFVLQGGTHRNLAVVKAQVDFIRGKVPDAEIVVHPYSGEAGAIGAALCAVRRWRPDSRAPLPRLRRDRGADVHEHDERGDRLPAGAPATASAPSSTCGCPAAAGRPWSKVPLGDGLGARDQRQLLPQGPASRTSTRCGW